MLNRKYYPFERNNYYTGKLLTAQDFEIEQRYNNDKRRLLNRLTGANGILAGLGVILADDTSIILQAGCALDASGREIVVPETRVIKLTTIDGYAELETSCAYVGIAYEEQPAERMYSGMGDAKEQTVYNKVQERYHLRLMDEAQAAPVPAALEAYLSSQTLYTDADFTLRQVMPRYAVHGSDLAVQVILERSGHGEAEYSVRYTLELPGFDTAGGGQNVQEVSVSGIRLRGGERRVFTYTFSPQAHLWGGEGVTASARGVRVRIGDEDAAGAMDAQYHIQPLQGTFTEQYLRDFYGRAMDKQLAEVYDERLWLAKLRLIRQGSSVIIDSVEPPPFGQYAYNAQQLMDLRSLEAFYPVPVRGGVPAAANETPRPGGMAPQAAPGQTAERMACGVFDLELGLGHSARDTVFSDEIMHGLGKGAVYVDVGVEYISADGKREESSEIYLGEMSIFEGERGSREDRVYRVSTAVKVLPDRGTFVVGVRLGDTSGLISLRIRWYAWRMGEVDSQTRLGGERQGERYILVKPDTVVVPPKGTAHITPVFVNMPTEPCRYSLLDARGGSIDNNGNYTAPSSEGVYEIRIEAMSDPSIYTHAFAVVSQKKKD